MKHLGQFELHVVSDGTFALDGGLVFGIVPKVIWEKLMRPDDLNRVTMGLACLLIKSRDGHVLLDTGVGDMYSEKVGKIYGIKREKGQLFQELSRVGVKPEDIRFVVNSHWHFDHCGNNLKFLAEGEPVPAFPNAHYFVQRREYEAAQSPDERTKASYWRQYYDPLLKSQQLHIVDGDFAVTQGVSVLATLGHTVGHQSVVVRDGGETLAFWGDLIPTRHHYAPAFVCAIDTHPTDTVETRSALLKQAHDEGWHHYFYHHPKDQFVTREDFKTWYEGQIRK
jgi:glyoxylase-like metal-dependent hydrolase (beta-lactamase superfamily II)